MHFLHLIVSIGFGHLLGSIPFGLLLTKLKGVGDIRKVGSGNIGATNVLRTGHKGLAFATLLMDALKGLFPVIFVGIWEPYLGAMAGIAAILGHVFPIWLKFKGGKGVATSFGVLLAIAPLFALVGVIAWLMVAFIWRYSSLAALVSSLLLPILAMFFGSQQQMMVTIFIAFLTIFTHKDNIKRIIKHQEPKIGSHAKPRTNKEV
ncbi:MAG: glycerol-3-phosphate acyltransferase [Alphaproteobacteria bacterium 43-37]|nr:MAG: glycerol-3-phosphate acyltransferase [Alphaproteobacteria bacterium 43-37]